MNKENHTRDASRPLIPGYGIPETKEGMLPWHYVQERMRNAQNYWISTSNAKGQPHSTPVWGVWVADILYFDGSPNTRRSRDMAANPFVSVHLEDGSQVVIMEGIAREQTKPPLELRQKIAGMYTEKYRKQDYSPSPDVWQDGGLYAFRANLVFAWTQFPQDSTRWQLDE